MGKAHQCFPLFLKVKINENKNKYNESHFVQHDIQP